ncbi:hypothetical protein [Catenulispora pinisilvae]|uniref:hypothetical protein n=1 Tax=Catenulispora pinisilvae TaxID=2705253 RepID=UPI00189216B0|nr:hypothetical protein [Catenulispora pinisilvae]
MVRSCRQGAGFAAELIERAHARLRADFTMADLATLTRTMARVIRDPLDAGSDEWRRFLAIYVDGLRAENA